MLTGESVYILPLGDACALFELPEDCLSELAIFTADTADRPSYTRLPDVEVGEGPLVAFLLGGAATWPWTDESLPKIEPPTLSGSQGNL